MNKKKILLVIVLLLVIILVAFFVIRNIKRNSSISNEKNNTNAVSVNQNGSAEKKGSFKQGYNKALEVVGNEDAPQLRGIGISVDNISSSNISYFFVTNKEILSATYYVASDIAMIANRRDKNSVGEGIEKQPGTAFFTDDDYPAVPENILALSQDDIQAVLDGNAEYKKYKQKYPELFKGYIASLSYYKVDSTWRWNVNFHEMDPQNQGNVLRSLDLSVDMGIKTVTVINRNNVE